MQGHYVCIECATVSKLPGTCQNETCIRQGQRTSECHCDDGKHEMVLGISTDEAKIDERQDGFQVNTLDLDSGDLSES